MLPLPSLSPKSAKLALEFLKGIKAANRARVGNAVSDERSRRNRMRLDAVKEFGVLDLFFILRYQLFYGARAGHNQCDGVSMPLSYDDVNMTLSYFFRNVLHFSDI